MRLREEVAVANAMAEIGVTRRDWNRRRKERDRRGCGCGDTISESQNLYGCVLFTDYYI